MWGLRFGIRRAAAPAGLANPALGAAALQATRLLTNGSGASEGSGGGARKGIENLGSKSKIQPKPAAKAAAKGKGVRRHGASQQKSENPWRPQSKKGRKFLKRQAERAARQLEPGYNAVGSQQTFVYDPKPTPMLANTRGNIAMEAMLAAGMHLGHSASLWNPLNLPYIFGERQGVHIINLEHTTAALRRAAEFVKSVAYNGGIIVFNAVRKTHRPLVVEAAMTSNQYFISGRWVPGTITNPGPMLARHAGYVKKVWDVERASAYAEHKTRAEREREAQANKGRSERFMKMVAEEKAKLRADDKSPHTFKPDLVIALNPRETKTMLYETRSNFVPTVGIIDTDANPREVTYPIPCNDDSDRAVKIVVGVLARAARDGLELRRARLHNAATAHENALKKRSVDEVSAAPIMSQFLFDKDE
ncbi:hypothetical protein GGF46_005401 [Coemansia sp. RSA 552]|nr:hypothetical protein GGF46_005401 [Coemansia sp. RSA 552]